MGRKGSCSLSHWGWGLTSLPPRTWHISSCNTRPAPPHADPWGDKRSRRDISSAATALLDRQTHRQSRSHLQRFCSRRAPERSSSSTTLSMLEAVRKKEVRISPQGDGAGGWAVLAWPRSRGGPQGEMGGSGGVIWAYLRSLLLRNKEWRWRMEQIIAAKPPAGEGGTKGKESKFRRQHKGVKGRGK